VETSGSGTAAAAALEAASATGKGGVRGAPSMGSSAPCAGRKSTGVTANVPSVSGHKSVSIKKS